MIFSKIKISNFQGASSVEFTLDASVNTISGANGSGKTTILDAINWCLFGKDYDDKSRFHIHEIRDVGNVSNEPISVEIEFIEAGVQRSVKRLLHGNITYCFVDGIPCKVGEYSDHIAKLTDGEDRFKLYSNPLYFFGLHWKEQRELLTRFFPEPSKDEVLSGACFSEEFVAEAKLRSTEKIFAKHLLARGEVEKRREQLLGERDSLSRFSPETLESLIESRSNIVSEMSAAQTSVDEATALLGSRGELAAKLGVLNEEKARIENAETNGFKCPKCGYPEGFADAPARDISDVSAEINDVRAKLLTVDRLSVELGVAREREIQAAVLDGKIQAIQDSLGGAERRIGEINDEIVLLNRKWETHDGILSECNQYVQVRTGIIADALNRSLQNVQIVITETLKNGEKKDCFSVYRNGIPYEALNTAGQLLCGLELSAFLKSGLGIECPLLIDNGERYVDVDLSKCGQVVVAKALVGEPLKINGRKVKK